ncbi:hypothetical protein D3C85_1354950 [compost metagenome]
MAHAVLAGHQLEQPEHRPQRHVTGNGAPQRVMQRYEQVETVDDQPQPHQRQHQHIRQQLMLGVDQAHGQQTPGQQHRHTGLPAETEVPGNERRQQAAGQFGQWITFADRCRASGAASPQKRETQ